MGQRFSDISFGAAPYAGRAKSAVFAGSATWINASQGGLRRDLVCIVLPALKRVHSTELA
jgi:hypothetical protein